MACENSIVKPGNVIVIQDGTLKGKFLYVSNACPTKITGWMMSKQKAGFSSDNNVFHLITPQNECYIYFNNKKSIKPKIPFKLLYIVDCDVAKEVILAYRRYVITSQRVPLDIKGSRPAPSNYITFVQGGSCIPR